MGCGCKKSNKNKRAAINAKKNVKRRPMPLISIKKRIKKTADTNKTVKKNTK